MSLAAIDQRPAAMPAGGIGLTCRGLVYIYRLEGYDVVALAGVDLDIAPGESVALVGPSGSGKSTLMAVFGGLLTPSAGRLMVGGRDRLATRPVSPTIASTSRGTGAEPLAPRCAKRMFCSAVS